MAAVSVQTALHLTNGLVVHLPGTDANADGNVWSWASSVATFTAAFVVLLLALTDVRVRARLVLLAGVLAYFSLDDVVALHERVDDLVTRSAVPGLLYHALWELVYLPLLAFVLVVLSSIAGHIEPASRRYVRLGLLLLVAAVMAELLWFELGGRNETTAGVFEVGFEEALELGGWMLVAVGLTAAASARLIRLASEHERSGLPRTPRRA